MSRKIAYIGFGVLGKQISVLLRQTSKDQLEEIYFDDPTADKKIKNAYPFNQYQDDRFSEYDFFICLGYKHLSTKNKLAEKLKELNRNLPSYIHPSCIVNPEARIEPGCILYPGCNIDQQVVLKEGSFLNNSVIVSHESIIGGNSFIAPGVIICGNVQTGEQCFFGAGAVISNGVKIGKDVIVGAGTVVTNDIPSNVSVIGNPMRILDTKIELR